MNNVQYVLQCFNYNVNDTVPQSYDLMVLPVSGAFDEGIGQDDKTYIDKGYVNWMGRTQSNAWITPGGDTYSGFPLCSQHFDQGDEDLAIDVTPLIIGWLTGSITPDGLLIQLMQENDGNDYYRKTFYSRETHVVEKVPFLEARWNDVRKDNRGNFAYNQPNALYLYNLVRGNLTSFAGNLPTVRVQDNWIASSCSFIQTYTASLQDTGIYAAAVSVSTTQPNMYSSSWIDIWQDNSGRCLMTGTFYPMILTGSQFDQYNNFVVSTDMKRVYRCDESARISVNVRKNFYTDNIILHTASLDMSREYMESMFYSVVNNDSGETVIPFATGSAVIPYTKLSYDQTGNYFNMNFGSFVPGFVYRILFCIMYNKYEKDVIDDKFIFRVL